MIAGTTPSESNQFNMTSHHAPVVNLPPGFHFSPTDQELINDYLRKKVNDEPTPYEICSLNVYQHNPQELTGCYPTLGRYEWYFYTRREPKYKNAKRPNREAGNGFWKASNADKPIYDNNVCIGSKRTLVFYEGKFSEGKKTNWIMHEYVAVQPSRQHIGTTDMVLEKSVMCRIYNKSNKASKNEQCAAISISCQIEEQGADKCSENEKLETDGTNQQHNIPRLCNLSVLQPNQEDGKAGDNLLSSLHTQAVGYPVGFRFTPTDQELIKHYLKKKANDEPIPYDICSVKVYNHNPQELTEYYPCLGRNEWYFFTSRDRKYKNGNRPSRAAGNGFWKAAVADKPIYDNDVEIGYKRSLVFYEGNFSEGKRTNWIMHEYVIDRPSGQHTGTNDMLLNRCVMCRIYNSSKGVSKDEKCAATSISYQTEEQETGECTENGNLETHKRAKYEHEGTSQQYNIPSWCSLSVLDPTLTVQQYNLPVEQYDLLQPPVQHVLLQPNLGLGQHNLPVEQYDLLQPNLGLEQQYLPVEQYDLLQPNLGLEQQYLPVEQYDLLQPNLGLEQQYLPVEQYDILEENSNGGGWLNYCMEGTSGAAGQNNYETIEDELGCSISLFFNDEVELQPGASLLDYVFGD